MLLTRDHFNSLLHEKMPNSYRPDVQEAELPVWVDIHTRYVSTLGAPAGMLTAGQFNSILRKQELEELPAGALPRSLDAWWDLYRDFQNAGERPMQTDKLVEAMTLTEEEFVRGHKTRSGEEGTRKISAALSGPTGPDTGQATYFYMISNGKEARSGALRGTPGDYPGMLKALDLPEGWIITALNRL